MRIHIKHTHRYDCDDNFASISFLMERNHLKSPSVYIRFNSQRDAHGGYFYRATRFSTFELVQGLTACHLYSNQLIFIKRNSYFPRSKIEGSFIIVSKILQILNTAYSILESTEL